MSTDKHSFLCISCGAEQEYKPGTDTIECPYCGAHNKIDFAADLEEQDITAYLEKAETAAGSVESMVIKCPSCQAESTLPENYTDTSCPFCGFRIQDEAKKATLIKVHALAPFQVKKRTAHESFRKWLKKLWFAPNKLKKYYRMDDSLKGIYIPYWTYDSNTSSQYQGERGDHYYVNESYQTTDSDGKPVMRTRQAQRTRWHHASGNVSLEFDDILVLASKSLPQEKALKLEPWDLGYLVEYKEDYLTGFTTEAYQVSLADGFQSAKVVMDGRIHYEVRSDIGGDEQRVYSVNTQYNDVKFKHILLPIWMNSYRYKDKVYRFLVNGLTGEVQGERPWSAWKIIGMIVTILAVIGGGIWLYSLFKS